MNRREFTVGTTCLLALGALGLPMSASAQPKKPEEGVDYNRLSREAPVDAGASAVEVVDFFWYSCPHCNAFEPLLQAWIKRQPTDVVVKRVPVGFRDDFVPEQRLFYTLDALGRLDELHQKVFDAVHKERHPMSRSDVIADWAEKQGIDRARFMDVYNSFAVSAKQRRAMQIQEAYKVEGVPAMGVAGRFYTDGNLTGSNPKMLTVVDYLVAETRKAR